MCRKIEPKGKVVGKHGFMENLGGGNISNRMRKSNAY